MSKTQAEKHIEDGILDLLRVYPKSKWRTWAEAWLNGSDRSSASAQAAVTSAAHDAAKSAAQVTPEGAVMAQKAAAAAAIAGAAVDMGR